MTFLVYRGYVLSRTVEERTPYHKWEARPIDMHSEDIAIFDATPEALKTSIDNLEQWKAQHAVREALRASVRALEAEQ